MTRYTIGLLLAFSFSVNAFDENPIAYVQPKSENLQLGACDLLWSNNPSTSLMTPSECSSLAFSTTPPGNTEYTTTKTVQGDFYGSLMFQYSIYQPFTDTQSGGFYVSLGKWVFQKNAQTKICPPDDAPDYIIGPTTAPDGTEDICLPKFEKCPLGYFGNAVTSSSGASQCVPISCPAHGSESQFSNFGQITEGSSGTYCDGKCAYSVSPEQGVNYNGASFASGTSLGAVCGQGAPSDAFYQPSGENEDSCIQHPLSSGGTYLECSASGVESPEPDTSEGDLSQKEADSSVDPTSQPDPFQGEDCAVSGSEITCIGKNITDAIEHQTKEQKKLDDEKHNKLVKMEKETAEYIEQQQRDRQNRALAQSSQETQMIVNAITNIGAGSGTGSGGGEEGNSDLIEDYLPEPILAEFDAALDSNADKLEQAQSDLDTAIENALSNYNQNDGVWSNFKTIPNYLPADAVCQPFELGLEPHTIQLDLCQYNDIIKAAISFIFIILTALRLFYQSQRIIRNVALAQG